MNTQASVGTASRARAIACSFAELAGLGLLLFVARFLARGHLVTRADEMCHIGGIAVDVLAHGVRFPFVVYAQNQHDNGSLFSGLLAAFAFSLFGRRVLALQLITHLACAAGALAALWLVRACLRELALTSRRARWTATATFVVAIALAPRMITAASVGTTGIGNPAEGSAINTLLLAFLSRGFHGRSAARTAALWALAGFALFMNKGTGLVILTAGAAELLLAWKRQSPWRLASALGGFLLGGVPELLGTGESPRTGWASIASRLAANVQGFPHAFFDSVTTLAEGRLALLAVWVLALGVGLALLFRPPARPRTSGRDVAASALAATDSIRLPITLAMVVAVSYLHLAVLTVMAQGGLDHYTIYGYPTLAVLLSVLAASFCTFATQRWGESAGNWTAATAIALVLFLYRPDAVTWGFETVEESWHDRIGAACSWRLAEGFAREYDHGLAPLGLGREPHVIERCRSLVDRGQILDCVGGMARALPLRSGDGVGIELPSGLSSEERRAFAYYYGIRRRAESRPCDGLSPDLTAECTGGVQLACSAYGDLATRFLLGGRLTKPRCTIPEPPMDGYWAALRLDLLARKEVTERSAAPLLKESLRRLGSDEFPACNAIFAACY